MAINYITQETGATEIPFSNGTEQVGLVNKPSEGGSFQNDSVGSYASATTSANLSQLSQEAALASAQAAALSAADAEASRDLTLLSAAGVGSVVIASNANANRAEGAQAVAAASAASVAADLVETTQDTLDTAADRAQTNLDMIATAADRVQTGLDRAAIGTDASTATTKANEASASASAASASASAALASENNTADKLPLSGGSLTGPVTTTSTIDGRDVATDGTKLDGVAIGANNYTLPAGIATETYVGTQISNLVDASPATLNTLNELAAALGDDANFSTTMTNTLAGKVDDSQVLTNVPAGAVFTDTNTTYTVGDGGLTQVNFTTADNTKLDGIEVGATADQTAAQLLVAIKTVDGASSGLDADLLDGNHASAFLTPTGDGSQLSGLPATGATTAQANEITANTAKVGITTAQANAITANTAKVTNSTSASDLTSGTLADARFPATLPAISGANLTNLPITPAGTADFVASGTLPNGSPVVLKSDGTVEAAAPTASLVAESIPAGSADAFGVSGNTGHVTSAFDYNTANVFVVAYKVGSLVYVVVGTVSGTSVTFGTPVVLNGGANADFPRIAFDPNTAGKFVLTYLDKTTSTPNGTTIVGTVSGTSITFGTTTALNVYCSLAVGLSFDPNTTGGIAFVYQDGSNASYGKVKTATISGTTITFVTTATFNASSTYEPLIEFDPTTAGKFVVTYKDQNNSQFGTARVGALSGTSVSFGTAVVFNSGTTNYMSSAFAPNMAGKFVVAYQDTSNSNYGALVVGTVSGTSISFGAEVIFASSYVYSGSISFDPTQVGKFVIGYVDIGNSQDGKIVVGTLSGNTASFTGPSVYDTYTNSASVSFDSNNSGKFIMAYRDASSGGRTKVGQLAATVYGPTNLTATNFLGTSTAAYTDTQTATIMLQGGISTNQTGLTIGSTYYVQQDGTLSTTESSPSVIAGKALSTTDLFLANWSDVYTNPNLLVKTADLTVYAGDSIVVGAGGITITLPSSPSIGDNVIIKDGTGAVSTTPFTVAGNGSNIVSSASSLTFNSDWAEVRFVFINATIGWSV